MTFSCWIRLCLTVFCPGGINNVCYICFDLSSLCACDLRLGLDGTQLSSLETVKGLQHGLNTSGPVPQHLSWVSLFIKQHKTVTVILWFRGAGRLLSRRLSWPSASRCWCWYSSPSYAWRWPFRPLQTRWKLQVMETEMSPDIYKWSCWESTESQMGVNCHFWDQMAVRLRTMNNLWF